VTGSADVSVIRISMIHSLIGLVPFFKKASIHIFLLYIALYISLCNLSEFPKTAVSIFILHGRTIPTISLI